MHEDDITELKCFDKEEILISVSKDTTIRVSTCDAVLEAA